MRARLALLCSVASLLLLARPAAAAVINVSPADGPTAYQKIEAARDGDEVIVAPGTYAFRVYLTAQASAATPIHIHAADPASPPVWDLGTTLVDDAPGSYKAGDKARGCWQLSGASNYVIEGITIKNCRAKDADSAGLRYYGGTTGLVLRNILFDSNDNGLTGGTEASEATVEYSEFANNGNLAASSSAPTHNAYIYGGTFTLRYSYLHDPAQAQNLHCRAVTSTIEYNWFDRAKSYVGDLMTSDDYANNPSGSLLQTMVLRGNVVIQGSGQANTSQLWAIYNDEASGSPVSFSVTAINNTVIGAGGHAAFLHVSNADGTTMTASLTNNILSGTSQPVLVEDAAHGTVSGTNNWIQTGAAAAGLTASIIGASPGFNAPASDDFTLAPASACIGAGDTGAAGLPTAEYYENETVTREHRARASAKDLGAFEHDTTGPGIGPNGSSASSASSASASSSGSSASSSGAGGAGGATSSASSSGSSESASASSASGSGGGSAGTPAKSSGCVWRSEPSGEGGAALVVLALGLAVAGARERRRARTS